MKIQHKLSLVEDENGITGFMPENSVDMNFDAFYSHQGLFHDVFEHWFEGRHKNFKENNAFNIGGEISAMGALAYYMDNFYMEERSLNRNRGIDVQTLVVSTQDMITEGMDEEQGNYFTQSDLITIPYQKPVEDSYMLSQTIGEHLYKLAEYKKENVSTNDFSKSVKNWKIVRLYRWGYKMAQKMVPYSRNNENMIYEFLTFWKDAFKRIDAEELKNHVDTLEINVYTGKNMRWTAFYITHEGKRVNAKNIHYVEDFYDLYED